MFICSGLEGPQGLCSCTWRVGRPGLVVPHSPHRFRATSGSLCARVAGLLTWQLETPRVIVLGKEVGANLSVALFLLCSVDGRTRRVHPDLRGEDTEPTS